MAVPPANFFELAPKDTLEVPVKTMQEYKQDEGGGAIPQRKDLLLELSARWRDSFGRSGRATPKYWTVAPVPVRVVSPVRLRELRGEAETLVA